VEGGRGRREPMTLPPITTVFEKSKSSKKPPNLILKKLLLCVRGREEGERGREEEGEKTCKRSELF